VVEQQALGTVRPEWETLLLAVGLMTLRLETIKADYQKFILDIQIALNDTISMK
jgi:hypothetical protein